MTAAARRQLAIHGHFYQPPREDPFTGQVFREPGAEPYHDFNEKIAAECYRPNAELGAFGRISFDLGPTLAIWLERYDRQTYRRIVDQEQAHYRQHGCSNALAQVYSHATMPLASRREKIGKLSTLVGAGLLMAVPTFLVFKQPDLGTALVFVAILVGMLFMSGASIGWMALLAGATVAAAPIVVQSLADYQRARLFCFLDPYADPQGACYQLVQALNAVGSGGLFGQGLTAGRQNQLGFLPVQSTDFIFTVVAEELGFIGGVVLLVIFALLIWRILAIGWGARDMLGMMVAVGLASMILFQIMVNVGMVIGIMPVTGIPLPFVTYGGSSMISLLFGMGILQSVRMHALKPTF